MFTSPTYGRVSFDNIVRIIHERVASDEDGQFNLMIGTDSQNFDTTKVVVVIALHHVGNGGIFFYKVTHVPRITSVGPKLLYETQLSLECAKELMDAFDNYEIENGFDYQKFLSFCIHVDAGKNVPSSKTIPEIVGWINACGYKAVVKPDSLAASSIANKYSK